jgi:hypothetical protein
VETKRQFVKPKRSLVALCHWCFVNYQRYGCVFAALGKPFASFAGTMNVIFFASFLPFCVFLAS